MAEELALDLEELGHLQSIEPSSLPPPPQSSQLTKGHQCKELKSTVRPQNVARREGAKLEKTNDKSNPNKHRNEFSASMTIVQYVQESGARLNKGEHREDITVSLYGQILNKMPSSDSKHFFYDLRGRSSKVQIVADPRNLEMDEYEFSKFYSCIRPGDFIIYWRDWISRKKLFSVSRPKDEPSCFGTVFLTNSSSSPLGRGTFYSVI
ncbi:hypothetical protein TB2_004707 [Malus domestica]